MGRILESRVIFSWFAVLLAATLPAFSGERRALLVGIDDYTASSLQPAGEVGRLRQAPGRRVAWPNLEGAVNDAEAMREMLVSRYGFERYNVRVLTDQEATRAAILAEIDRVLVATAGAGDDLVFYFAGHGSHLQNPESAEIDGEDETLVPADSRWGAADVRDKELRRRFNQVLDKGARLTVILDSCYSGSGARGLPRWTRARGLPPQAVAGESGSPERALGPAPEECGALVLSAAQDFERAWETEDETGQARGAFSLALLRAMRASSVGEPAEYVFLRAASQLQLERALQYPVLAGNAEARSAALFGGRTDHRDGRTVVAVREVRAGGEVVLQGGWANGLTVDSELRIAGEGGNEVRLRVTVIEGVSYSKARILESDRSAAPPVIAKGALAELSGWAAPKGPPLRVWIPVAGDARQLAAKLETAAGSAGVDWSADPVADSPTHVLSWNDGSWRLLRPDGESEDLGQAPAVGTVIERIRETASEPRSRLFVHLPAPAELAKAIEIGPEAGRDAVEETADPSRADYFLVGRLAGGKVAYAWVRPQATGADRPRSALPLRTDWYSLDDPPKTGRQRAAVELERSALLLAKLRAWLGLKSPPDSAFSYQLALAAEDGTLATGGWLAGTGDGEIAALGRLTLKQRYGLVLRVRDGGGAGDVEPRYAYVFVIDSQGQSTLLFPAGVQGSVENRFPVLADAKFPPAKIPLGRQPLFEVSPPLGIDTYFLLTSEEPIPNPWVLQYPGVRVRGPEGRTPLEELLSLTGASTRGDPPVVPTTWSIERLVFESVAP